MLEKLKALDWYYQGIILIAVAAVVCFGVRYFFTGDIYDETARINEQKSQLESRNETAKAATRDIAQLRATYASKSAEYDELKVLLPEDREITNVLQGLQDTARDSRLIVARFSPKEDSQENALMTKPVEIEVDSNFNNLREFFDKMAKLPRIVSIKDFSLKQLDKQSADKTLHAQFTLIAYYAAPENLTPATAPATPGAVPPGAVPPAQPVPAAPIAK